MYPAWARVLLSGLGLWVASVVTTSVTGNANLVPTIILLGSFLVPVTFVVYAFARADGVLTAQRIFMYAGDAPVSAVSSGNRLAGLIGAASFAVLAMTVAVAAHGRHDPVAAARSFHGGTSTADASLRDPVRPLRHVQSSPAPSRPGSR